MRKNRTQRGMSLLEMSAASIVVAVSLLGTTAAVVTGASLSAEVTRLRAASRAATSIMEEVRSTDFADLVDTYHGKTVQVCDAESGIDDGTATVTVVQVDNGSLSHRIYEVTVTISFEGAGGAETYPIVTYVSDRVAGSSLASSFTLFPQTTTETTTGTTQTTDPIQDPVLGGY